MNKELKDILSNLNKDIEQEKLLEYLNRNLSAEEQHDLEKQLLNDDFAADAVEGLLHVEDKQALKQHIAELNAGLEKQLEKRKKKKEKRTIPSQFWVYIAIILVLILIMVSYFVIRQL